MEQREGIPIIVHIYTHEIYRIQANCVRGLCFPMPLFGGLLQRAGQKGDEGVLQAEGTACAKLAVSGAGDSHGIQGETDRLWARTGVGWGRACR